MHDYIFIEKETGFSSSDIIAVIAVILSVLSILVSGYFIFLAKRLEILYQQFEKLCINNVDNILISLDQLFVDNALNKSKDYRTQITNIIVELQLFLTSLQKSCYKSIDLNKIINITEGFTESIYEADDSPLLSYKGQYYSTKILIYRSLYKFALKKEIGLFYFIERH